MNSACLVPYRFLFFLFFKVPNFEVSPFLLGKVSLCLIAPSAIETTGIVYTVISVWFLSSVVRQGEYYYKESGLKKFR